jgi:hypothetical protein
MILGSSMGGALTQFTSFQIMISTSAILMLGGAAYLAVAAIRQTARVSKRLAC